MADEINKSLQKIAAMVKTIHEATRNNAYTELLTYSVISFDNVWNPGVIQSAREFKITLHVHPDVYVKLYTIIPSMAKTLRNDFNRVSNYEFSEIEILPDYDKFTLVDATIQPVFTPWDEINQSQEKLLVMLRQSTDHLDFQNIGNTARTILQNLADIVYDPSRHAHEDPSADMSAGKFKNRLNAYIHTELKGSGNEELRNFADAQITAMKKTIDLANATTHKLNVGRPFAEACAVGTIHVISIIKTINKSKA
ncbi:hypothetical protein [Dinghuibacter silviterrae]|uniref:Uncharacterized protein n=1 Tax=Dinghuibacter silviterrae TaxID=1539049 RepID=A0A4R8DV94_9BACT|nr:hypothetical protein [Dinghuibacter silviterrae]TDX01926.1 hypothetical protein EDB95_2971 [Dinghuibacter silviterrae]